MIDYDVLKSAESILTDLLNGDYKNEDNYNLICNTLARGLGVKGITLQFTTEIEKSSYLRIIPADTRELDIWNNYFSRKIHGTNEPINLNERVFAIEINDDLYRNCEFNSKELIGLIANAALYNLYSEKPFTLYIESFYKDFLNLPSPNKEVFKRMPQINKLIYYVIIEYFSTPIYNTPDNPNSTEVDKILYTKPYVEDYLSALNKIINKSGNFLINQNFLEIIENAKNIGKWLFKHSEHLRYRKTRLRDSLTFLLSENNSNVIQRVTEEVYKSFFVNELFSNTVMESMSYIDKKNKIVKEDINFERLIKQEKIIVEESLFNSYKEVDKFNFPAIDIVPVEIDRIETYDDKIFVINLIHEYLDTLYPSMKLSEIEFSKKIRTPRAKVTRAIADLEKYLDMAKSAKVYERQYGVFIRYPKGYEG
ncbi:MAG: hypothetical protein PHF63_00440 [Herbinix sp.]|nr:hypothetical protein [Herbinix sp.]